MTNEQRTKDVLDVYFDTVSDKWLALDAAIVKALNEAEERGRSGARNHPGCDYSATIYCNKCGWLGSKDQPTLFQDNNRALRETLEYAAVRIWTVYRDLHKDDNRDQRLMLYSLNNEIQKVLRDTKDGRL